MRRLVDDAVPDSIRILHEPRHRCCPLYPRRYSSTALRTNFDTDTRSETALR